MCDDTSVLTDMANNELVNKLMENLMVVIMFSTEGQEENYPLINLNLMLLANVSTVYTFQMTEFQNDMGAGAILQLRENQGKLKVHYCMQFKLRAFTYVVSYYGSSELPSRVKKLIRISMLPRSSIM